MTTKAKPKGEGMISGAPPTSPGGMSRKALVAELVQTHNYEVEYVKTQFAEMSDWPKLIDAVISERLLREHENSTGDLTVPDADAAVQPEPCVWCAEDHEGGPENCAVAQAGDLAGLVEDIEEAARERVAAAQPIFLGLPGVKDYIFNGHRGLGPSGAARWMTCTASLAASRKFLETLTLNQAHEFAQGSEAARQGTTAHAAAEAEANVMLGRLTDEELDTVLLELMINPANESEAYDDEMAEYITEYTDLIKQYRDDRGADHVMVEQHVEAVIPLMTVDSEGEEETYTLPGSADLIVLPTPEDPTLVVGDLKYGEGEDIQAEENPQALVYAIGALDLLIDDEGNLITDVEKVIIHIVQPRLGGIKTWEITLDELFDWRDEVLSPALTEALGGAKTGAKFVPSAKACQWCPARGACPALIEDRMNAASELFEVMTEHEVATGEPGEFPETEAMDSADLARYYSQIMGLTKLQKEMREEVNRRLQRGQDVPGFWLVNYSPNRHWSEDAPVEKMMEIPVLVTKPALLSPPAAEKVLSKEQWAKIEKFVVKPDKKPVPSTGPTDKRSRWVGKAPEDMFANEEGDES